MTEPRRRSPRRREAARSQLDRDRILTHAGDLIEQVGLPAFSMRGLAATLGVEAMSLYHYFPSKAHLCDALLDRLLATLPPFDDSLPWAERLRARALAFRAAVLSQPAFATFLLTHRLNTRVALEFIGGVARLFTLGHSDTELAARQFRVFGYYVMGALLDETSGYAHGPTAAEPLALEAQHALAPELLSFAPFFARQHWDSTFELGLRVLLTAFERERRHAP